MDKILGKRMAADELDEEDFASQPTAVQKNYITPAGFARLKTELDYLVDKERPTVVQTVAWAAGNGDRSENGDYIYGKKRLREIDRRIRFLVKRLDMAEVIDPVGRGMAENADQIFFGATVTVCTSEGLTQVVSIVGIDEIDLERNYISWLSPMARALIKAREGDRVVLRVGNVIEELEICSVSYQSLEIKPFQA